MVSDLRSLLLELLCSAIWNRPVNSKLFTGLNASTWDALLTLSAKQAVAALVADRALSLPADCLPPLKNIGVAMAGIKKTEELNSRLKQILKFIGVEYTGLNIPFILLKGQANAVNYPKPTLRSAGDIDLFLYREGDYEKANEWVLCSSLVHHIDFLKEGHLAFEVEGYMIENHKYITFFAINKYNKILQQELQKVVQRDGFESIDINGDKIRILPRELNGFYIFLHMFFHFIHAGLGFKQFCDWILFQAKYYQEMDTAYVKSLARSFKLLRPMQIFAQTAVEYLEAPPEIFPFGIAQNKKYPRIIMQEIWDGGNFGFYHKNSTKGLWVGRWYRYRKTWAKSIRFATIAPSYILLVPVITVINRIKLTFMGK